MVDFLTIESAEDFLKSVEKVYERYCYGSTRSAENLLYVIIGLTHIREWISPNYNPDRNGWWREPRTDAEVFSKMMYEKECFTKLKETANGVKHARPLQNKNKVNVNTNYSETLKDWDTLGDVKKLSQGAPVGHEIDGLNVDYIINNVIEMYREWFNGSFRFKLYHYKIMHSQNTMIDI